MSTSLLIVDDEQLFLSTTKKMLKSFGDCEILTATNALDALAVIKEREPELVLMDIYLGDKEMDGITCVEKIRDIGFQGAICMITGNSSIEKMSDALAAGADDYWVKCSEESLRTEVEYVLSRRNRPAATYSTNFHPVPDGANLRSRELQQEYIEALFDYFNSGFVPGKEMASNLGKTPSAVSARFSRIKTKLGFTSIHQISQLMTILSVYSKRRNRRWNGAEDDDETEI